MTIAVDATGTVLNQATATSASYTGITVGSGLTNGALVVWISWGNHNITSITAVTWGGTAMTALKTTIGGASGALYGLINPASGNQTLAVSWNTSAPCEICAQSYSGVLQTGGTTTWPNSTSNSGTSLSPSVSVTSATNNLPLNILLTNTTPTISALTQTQVYLDNGTNVHGAGQTAPGAASVSFGATLSSSTAWIMMGVDMVAAASTATPPPGQIQTYDTPTGPTPLNVGYTFFLFPPPVFTTNFLMGHQWW